MNLLRRRIAALAAALIFAGSLGCSAVKGEARTTSDAYIDALLSMDYAAADSLCSEGRSWLDDYMTPDYKVRAVRAILSNTHYRFEPLRSGRGEDGSLNAVYTLVMPDINRTIESRPSNYDEYLQSLSSMGKSDVTVCVNLLKTDGKWMVTNSEEIAGNLYGSLFFPEYAFVLDGASVLENGTWTSTRDDGSFEDTEGISCHYTFSDEYLNSGVSLDLTYEYYRNDELIYSSEAVFDADGTGVSFPVNVEDTGLRFDYLPEFDYRLVVLSSGNYFFEDHKACTLGPLTFSDASAVDSILWQNASRDGRYYNESNIVAKVWLNSRYLDSGRPVDITFDVFYMGELVLSGGSADVYDSIAICSFGSDELLATGDYSINVYNNGTFSGSSVTNVILNLNPSDYTETEVPSEVTDAPDEELEIFTGSSNSVDMIDDYTDVDFDYTSISMNIFEDRMDAILASGENAPDIIVCDSAYARQYAMSDVTIPLNDIGISYSELQYMYEYTFAMTLDENKVIKGVTWEITPGAVFYCRSAALSNLGVSEPGEVTPYFASWDAIIDTARIVNETSGGNTRLFASVDDIEDPYILGRPDSWFDADGNVLMTDYMSDYLPFIEALSDEELTFNEGRWSSEWTSRMSNRSVIAQFGTMRFGTLFLEPSHPGDWGVVMPPVNYFDGGNYIFVTRYCDMDASAAQFIRDVSINESSLQDMADDGYAVNNISIMMACADDDTYSESWLNGQNPFKVFSQVAWGIDASTVSSYDDMINEEFVNLSHEYINNVYGSQDEAVAAFEQAVEERLG